MKFFQKSTIILNVCICVLISNRATAGILWQKDLVYDVNTNSRPLVSCINKNGSGVIVITKVAPKGTLTDRGDTVLWEIGAGGNILRKVLLKGSTESTMKTNALTIGDSCAMAADRLGNLLTVGALGEQRKDRSLAVISTAKAMEPNVMAIKKIDRSTIAKLISFQDNTFVLVGRKNKDGLCQQIDNQGEIIQEKQFDIGQNEKFTDVDWIKSDNSSLAIVGLSMKVENTAEMSGENFIVRYDPNFSTVYEDHFMGWKSISALSLVSLQPKVCYLDNGNIVVLYNKESTDPNNKDSADPKIHLWARCYTQELKLLWEKEIFTANKSPKGFSFYFDIISSDSGFVSVIRKPTESIEFHFFNENGSKSDYAEYEGLVTIPGFNLMRMNDKIIAVFEEFSGPGKLKEITIKTKVIALD